MLNLGKRGYLFGKKKIYPYATGGDYVYLYEDTATGKTYRVHEFLSTGTSTLEVEVGGEMDILVVGGGGGGGSKESNNGGGGGGGGGSFIEHTTTLSVGKYNISVGTGGAGSGVGTQPARAGAPGNASSFINDTGTSISITATGGGGGSEFGSDDNIGASTGGSGGGGGAPTAGALADTYTGIGDKYGNNGGNGTLGASSNYLTRAGGGGGGAGGAGSNATSGVAGGGGNGRTWLNGKTYAGGGGGGAPVAGSGGSGGGGAGSVSGAATPGANNTGGGGGGSRQGGNATGGGNGGSGIVIVRYVIAEKTLWTPSELASLEAWWDASDDSTLFNQTSGGTTPSDNGEVARWEDKSGNSRTLTQATGSERPLKINNEVNNLPIIRFANDKLDGSPFMYDLGQMTFCIVYKSIAAAQSFLISEGRTTNNTPIYSPICSGGSSSNSAFFYRPDNGTTQLNYVSMYNWYSWNILTILDSGNKIDYTGDGGQVTSVTSSYTRSATTLDLFRIGELARGADNQFPNNADIAEIVVFDSVLSTTDRQKLEGYLAHKWGLTDNLPSGHPYKYEPPYKVESEEIVTDGLVLNLDAGDYASYPRSGTTWYDLSGNGNNGTLTNGPTYNSANKGSIVFDGSNDYILFGSNPSLTNKVTVEVWVKLDSPTGVNSSSWVVGRENSYRILYSSGAFQWICATSNNGWYTTGTVVTASSLNPYTETYQIVGVYDGSNNKIYVNGELISTGSAISGNILNQNNFNLMLSSAGNVNNGKGKIYSTRVYNRALSSTEIQQNFNALRGRYGV